MTEENSFDEAIESGLVFRTGAYYHIKVGDNDVALGKGKEHAEKIFYELQANDALPEDTSKSETLKSEDTPLKPAPLNEDSANSGELKPEEIENLLGDIDDLKPNSVGMLDVFYNGVNVFDYSHPTINRLGIVLRWRLKQDKDTGNMIIDDGKGNFTCNGWQVLQSNRYKVLTDRLDVKRNDTPNLSYITNGDLVLCLAKKKQYDEMQLKKSMDWMRGAKMDNEKRKAIGQNFKKYNNENDALSSIEGVNQVDKSSQNSQMEELENLASEL